MGRKEQNERAKKRAAKNCVSLLQFVSRKKAKGACSDDGNGDDVDEACGPSKSNEDENLSVEASEKRHFTFESSHVPDERSHTMNHKLATGIVRLRQFNENQQDKVTPCQASQDIGKLVNASMSSAEVEQAVARISPGDKYLLLKHHSRPEQGYIFPAVFTGGCNRSFHLEWLSEFPWMVYSKYVDGAYCISCALFCTTRSNKGVFVNTPFTAWQKKSEKCKEHERSKYHQEALQLAEEFSMSMTQPTANVRALVDEQKANNIHKNKEIVKAVAETILFCGRQCIALRGDNETIEGTGNPGNFLSLLKLIAHHNEIVNNHLSAPALRNAKYISPLIQNQILEILGKDCILSNIVKEVKGAKYYAILADEVTSHNTEHLALCVRFVDGAKNIREEFLQFIPVARISGEVLARTILGTLEEIGLDAENIRGQGYDGASNMSSHRLGVQARIKQVSPLATYTHCAGHCLNLVIAHSCSLPEVRNVLDRLKHCCRFFLFSPKRSGLLQEVVKAGTEEGSKRKVLLDLCRTRWAERQSAYQHFYQAFVFIVEALEVIGCRIHLDSFPTFADWDPATRSEAQQILACITSFDFIVMFLIMYQYLSHLAGITVKLQATTLDIIHAHQMIIETSQVYTRERENIDNSFQTVYNQAVRMAEEVGTSPSRPRVSKRQQHRSNSPSDSIFEHYKVNAAIKFLDHVIADLDTQFSSLAVTASSLLGLVPQVLCQQTVDTADMVDTYKSDLPSPELLPLELQRWKLRYDRKPEDQRPSSPAAAIKECDQVMFPNLYVLLQIACTIPVTSCECERSASVLRRLNTYMRASMGKERLSWLALLHIHYDKEINLGKVVQLFSRKHPRRMEMDSIVSSQD